MRKFGLIPGLLLIPSLALAAGYQFDLQSTSALGSANASAAEAADASVLFYNPAGLARLNGRSVSAGLHLVSPRGRFTPGHSTVDVAPLSASTGTGDGGVFTALALVPNAYLALPLKEGMTAGIGFFVPWGTKVEYDEHWSGRYNLVETELKSFNINPSLGWRVNDRLSLGAGLSAQWVEGRLARKIHYGVVLADLLANPAFFGDPQYDGTVSVEGDDWGWGFNLGALLDLDRDTRLGLAYRSAVKHQLKGGVTWRQNAFTAADPLFGPVLAAAQASAALGHVDGGAVLGLDTPESLSASLFHQASDKLALMGDLTWVRQSRFREVRIRFDNGAPPSITPERWGDVWRLALGARYQWRGDLALRAGIAYEQSPVNDGNRTASLPDNDRWWLTLGASIRRGRHDSWDFAYAHARLADSSIRAADDGAGEVPCNCNYSTLRGRYSLYSNIVSAQYNHSF
jgi:long-chain fatty acid transport protein